MCGAALATLVSRARLSPIRRAHTVRGIEDAFDEWPRLSRGHIILPRNRSRRCRPRVFFLFLAIPRILVERHSDPEGEPIAAVIEANRRAACG